MSTKKQKGRALFHLASGQMKKALFFGDFLLSAKESYPAAGPEPGGRAGI
jgi:hypothetical protein